MTLGTELAAISLCLVLSAFFSSSETALLRMRLHQLDADIESPNALSALAAKRLVGSTSKLLVTILLGNNVTNIFAAALASALAVRLLGEERGVLVAGVVLTAVVLVFCEVLPKAVAASNPRRVSYFVALPLYLMHGLARPAHWLFDRVLFPVVRRLAGTTEDDAVGDAELLELARRLSSNRRTGSAPWLLGKVARAVDRMADEIMTPRPDLVAVPRDTVVQDLLARMLAERYTRVLIFHDTIDTIVGFVHFKDLVKADRAGVKVLDDVLKPVLRVPERKSILDLMAEMQRDSIPLAVVKDEFGVTVGLVTQEDVLEEFVGEIRDEFDGVELKQIRRIGPGRYRARGTSSVLDFNRTSGWKVPAEAGETLAGLVFNKLGRSPHRGDKVVVEPYEFVVTTCRGTVIEEVIARRVTDRPPPEEPTIEA